MQGRSALPQAIEVLGEQVQGPLATVIVSGRRQGRETQRIIVSRGTVTFVKEDGTWRIRHETWADIGEEPVPDDAKIDPAR